MNLELERWLDSISFTGRLALDGTVQRYGRKGNQWLWSLAKGDNTFVVAGDWSTGERVQFGSKTIEIRQAMREISNVRADKAKEAARHARERWELLTERPTGRTYLERKGVVNYGLRFAGNDLFVPMYGDAGIVGLQCIRPDGTKRFTSGCSKRGASYRIHGAGGDILCEGYATGASIHMATGRPVIIAFDCGNLAPVAERWGKQITTVAADNDTTLGNPGLTAGAEAAKAIGARVVWPRHDGMDFNDVHAKWGLDHVKGYFV